MNNKQPKPQEPKQNNPTPKQEPVNQPQMSKQNNPVLKQTQPKTTQPKTSTFKPDKKIEKYANSNQFRVDHAHDFDDDYEQEFKDNDFDSNEKDVFDLKAEKHTESDKFKKDHEHDFDENNEEDLSVDNNSNNNSREAGDLGYTLDELEDSGIFNVKMVDEEGNIVFDGNSMDAPLWDKNGNEYAISKIDKDELNRSGIIHLKNGSNNKSLELKHQQLEELVPEDKREQTKLLLDYFVNDLGIDEETALDSIIESAKKVKKL